MKYESKWTHLGKLFKHVSIADFFGDIWGKQCVSSNAEPPFACLSLSDFALLLRRCAPALTTATFRVVVNQRIVPFSAITREFRTPEGNLRRVCLTLVQKYVDSGATVVLRDARAFLPDLDDYCRFLEAEFMAPVTANIYATPPNSQGFPMHEDQHDIIVVQMSGLKHWKILKKPNSVGSSTADDATGYKEFLLEPNDVMYVPRRHAHEASAKRGASLHLTIGIHTPTLRQIWETLPTLLLPMCDFGDHALSYSVVGPGINTESLSSIINTSPAKLAETIVTAHNESLTIMSQDTCLLKFGGPSAMI